ncbi:hypothetical protein AB0M79_29230 [Polymorphospora sp. NPDC051019]|uniref:hypothetical protein n=1 Tax=Polymorphospora sp. NPDC051019 TaxID=3155725 RepID=UPI00343F9FAB
MRSIRELVAVTATAALASTLVAAPAQALAGLACSEYAHSGYYENDTYYVVPYCKWYTTTGEPGGGGRDPGELPKPPSGPGGGGHGEPGREHPPMTYDRELCDQLTRQHDISQEALKVAHEQAESLFDFIQGGNPVTDDDAIRFSEQFQTWQLTKAQVQAMRENYIRFNGIDPKTGDGDWKVDTNARYGQSLSQALELDYEAKRKFEEWEDTYTDDAKQRVKGELSLLLQQIGAMERESRMIRDLKAEACAKSH